MKEYVGIFCTNYVGSIVLGFAGALVLYSEIRFEITAWFLIVAGLISFILYIRCQIIKPKILAAIDVDSVTINNEKESIQYHANELDYAIKRLFHVEVRKRDGTKHIISNRYFIETKDIKSFIKEINALAESSY